MDQIKLFHEEKKERIKKLGKQKSLKNVAFKFLKDSAGLKYTYNFSWLDRPIIQLPQDIIAVQEIIFDVKPDLIIETGIAHGGGLIFYASILELIGKGKVLGIDIDIRKHNRKKIEKHRMFQRIEMIEGSSIDKEVFKKVKNMVGENKKVLVILDSLHTHEHVLEELNLYSTFVSKGSYLVVFDTIVEYLPKGFTKDRPWDKGNNPATAVKVFLKRNKNFVVDETIENKLLITAAPGGYLKRIK